MCSIPGRVWKSNICSTVCCRHESRFEIRTLPGFQSSRVQGSRFQGFRVHRVRLSKGSGSRFRFQGFGSQGFGSKGSRVPPSKGSNLARVPGSKGSSLPRFTGTGSRFRFQGSRFNPQGFAGFGFQGSKVRRVQFVASRVASKVFKPGTLDLVPGFQVSKPKTRQNPGTVTRQGSGFRVQGSGFRVHRVHRVRGLPSMGSPDKYR